MMEQPTHTQSDATPCAAKVYDAMALRPRPCVNSPRYIVGGYSVCGTHRKVLERWHAQGRLESMVKFWWAD